MRKCGTRKRADQKMFVSYESWRKACEMIKKEGIRLQSYFQWYPFFIISEKSWKKMMARAYYNEFIKDASFLLSKDMRFVIKGFLQKNGASLRKSHLVSPVLFIYLLAYGIEYNKVFIKPSSGSVSCWSKEDG